MKILKHTRENGFTLAETLVALVVGMVLLTAIYSVVNMAQKSTTGIEGKVVAQQDARVALEIMALEIRMASYSVWADNGIWVNPATCSPQNPTYRGIRSATANSLTIEMDINDDRDIADKTITSTPPPTTNLNDENEIIAYEYLPAEQRITRETIRCDGGSWSSSGGQPFLGPSATDPDSGGVKVINGSLNIPLYRYYNGQGAEIYPTTADQDEVPNIRRIAITIAVETRDADPATGQKRTLIYGTSVTPKNHAITVGGG